MNIDYERAGQVQADSDELRGVGERTASPRCAPDVAVVASEPLVSPERFVEIGTKDVTSDPANRTIRSFKSRTKSRETRPPVLIGACPAYLTGQATMPLGLCVASFRGRLGSNSGILSRTSMLTRPGRSKLCWIRSPCRLKQIPVPSPLTRGLSSHPCATTRPRPSSMRPPSASWRSRCTSLILRLVCRRRVSSILALCVRLR